jgi:hypothetical protein
LYSVELPGQEQRRRNAVDELNMRSLYGWLILSFHIRALLPRIA